ncbi:uncharacterized protein [Littorina saxatilis]|uniref:Uncharacterized protein n=1 Tax=Littorina saxatilis TaxID=31220 RepID=A0AAN9C426_9CAEN
MATLTLLDVCNKKRMAAACLALVLVTLVTMTLRIHWSYTAQLEAQLLSHKTKANSSCGKQEMTVLSSCQRCPREELRAEEAYCMETGYKQWVKCADGRSLYNWCDITPAVEERQFWMFELMALVITGASYSVVFIRQRKNDQQLMDKIHRQIGLTT